MERNGSNKQKTEFEVSAQPKYVKGSTGKNGSINYLNQTKPLCRQIYCKYNSSFLLLYLRYTTVTESSHTHTYTVFFFL